MRKKRKTPDAPLPKSPALNNPVVHGGINKTPPSLCPPALNYIDETATICFHITMTYVVEDIALDNILETVENGTAAQRPSEERCRLISDLKNAIDERCPAGARTHDTCVPPGWFARERQALTTVAQSLRFSPAWSSRCDQALFRHAQLLMRDYPASRMKNLWPTLDPDSRLDMLREIADRQCALFSGNGINFVAPTICADSLAHSNIGGFSFYPGLPPVRHMSEIIFDTTFLKNIPAFEDALGALWHEQLHSLHYQLACEHGTLPTSHPYAGDAAMMLAKILNNAHLSPRYGTLAYRADVEETLCLSTQKTLATHYAGFSGQYLQSIFRAP